MVNSINTTSPHLKASYPASKNLLALVRSAINEKPANNAVSLAKGIIIRANLLTCLNEYHEKSDTRPSGYAREFSADIETVNKEIKEIAVEYTPRLERSLNVFLDAFKKNIKLNPSRNIKLLTTNNFGKNSLLTSLLLTACAFSKTSKAFKALKNAANNAIRSSGDTGELFKTSVLEAKQVFVSQKNRKEKTDAAISICAATLPFLFPQAGIPLKAAMVAFSLTPNVLKLTSSGDKINEKIKNIEILEEIM